MVEMCYLVLKFKRSKVIDVGEEKKEEPVTSQVIKTEFNNKDRIQLKLCVLLSVGHL
jgi:hypothetical protein